MYILKGAVAFLLMLVVSTFAYAETIETSVAGSTENQKVRVLVRFKSADFKAATASVSAGYSVSDELLADVAKQSRKDALVGLESEKIKLVREFKYSPEAVLELSKDDLHELLNNPLVEEFYEDIPMKLPDYQVSNTAAVLSSIETTGALYAWNKGYTGSGQYIAILDTGILSTHEMFKDKKIIEACFSSRGSCPGGTKELKGKGAAAPHSSSFKDYEHGTHVSGIAAGRSSSVEGVAKGADIIAVQVFSIFTNDRECGTEEICLRSLLSDQLAALEYIYELSKEYPIAAVNMSFGSGTSSSFCENSFSTIIEKLTNAGVAVVAAAGNSSGSKDCTRTTSPACIEKTISVGSIGSGYIESDFSMFLKGVTDIMAPGERIRSAVAKGNSAYGVYSGTSMSTPQVSGAFAIFRQADKQAPVADLVKALKDTQGAISYTCEQNAETVGRLRIDAALAKITGDQSIVSTKEGIWEYYNSGYVENDVKPDVETGSKASSSGGGGGCSASKEGGFPFLISLAVIGYFIRRKLLS